MRLIQFVIVLHQRHIDVPEPSARLPLPFVQAVITKSWARGAAGLKSSIWFYFGADRSQRSGHLSHQVLSERFYHPIGWNVTLTYLQDLKMVSTTA